MNAINNYPLGIPLTRMSPTQNGSASNSVESTAGSRESFKDLLLESLRQVNSMQVDADSAVQQLLTGGDVNPAEVLTSLQKADLSFRMVMQIRNKLLQAYQEIKDVRI